MNFEKFRHTGELSDIIVIVDKTEFKLHTFPLFTKSDYFRKAVETITTSTPYVVRLDNNFPGGARVFNQLADYFYSIPIDIDHKNIIPLRSAACFIQCNALSTLLDERFDRILLVARAKFDLGIPLVLLEQCIGEYQEWAKKTSIVDKCLECIVESLARGAGLQLNKSDREIIVRLPLEWIIELIKLCPKDSKLAVLPFVKHYVTVRVLDTNAFYDSWLFPSEYESERQSYTLTNNKREDVDTITDDEKRNILDEIVNTLGNALEQLPLLWLNAAYEKSVALKCQCELQLLACIAQSILNSTDLDKSVEQIPDDVMERLLEHISKYKQVHVKDSQLLTKLSSFVDYYVEQLRRRSVLTNQQFVKLASYIPKEQRDSHDSLLRALDDILKNERSTKLSSCEREELFGQIDFSRVSEETIAACKSNKLIPQQLITEAALALCTKLRNQLDETRSRLSVVESELAKSRTNYSNCSCRKQYYDASFNISNRPSTKYLSGFDIPITKLTYNYLKYNYRGDVDHILPIRYCSSSSNNRYATYAVHRH